MNLNNDDKQILFAALKVYAQIAKKELPKDQYASLIVQISDVHKKIKESIEPQQDIQPEGVTEDQFNDVCLNCSNYEHKCIDTVAKKYPGKCDPILHYINRNTKLIDIGDKL